MGVQYVNDSVYYVRARYYSATTGRFINRDPYEYNLNSPQTINRYVYSLNNSVNMFDWTGLYGDKDDDGSSNITPWGVGWEWLTGTGSRHRDFTNGDYFTELLRQHSHIIDIKNQIINDISNGGIELNKQYEDSYTLSGLKGVLKFKDDLNTLLTFGLTGNLAVTYLGSYNLKYTVTDLNMENQTANVNFIVKNSSTIQSATHPPVIGYTKWWNENIGSKLDSMFESGLMSKTTQTFNWNEKIDW